MENISVADLSDVMNFYHDDYNNNGTTKADVENFYSDILQTADSVSFQAEISNYNTNLEIIWNLKVINENTQAVLVDSTISDVLLPTRDYYQFFGNQAALQKIMIELFTATWCPNCPYVENALHTLKEEYGSKISYVEYHMFDEYDFGNSDIANYYGASAFPHTFINGSTELEGGSEESLDIIEEIIQPMLNEVPNLVLSDLNFTVSENGLSGNVKIDTELQESNMFLKVVIIENENNGYHNIVLKQYSEDISSEDFSQPIDFSISNVENLPEDATLVLWIQILEPTYNNNCIVYNVIEKAIQ
jgi:thiol-disulfide isomerase/thioredoxin